MKKMDIFKKSLLQVMIIIGISIPVISFAVIKKGPYFGIQGGLGGMDTRKACAGDTYHKDDLRKWIVRGYLGYLWGAHNLKQGVEIGYSQYSDNIYENSSAETFKYRGHNGDLAYILKYGIASSGLNIFGKAGIAYVWQTTKATASSYKQYESDQFRWWPKLAVGLGYEFTIGVAVNLTYEHIFGQTPARLNKPFNKSDVDRVASVDGVMLGLSYHI